MTKLFLFYIIIKKNDLFSYLIRIISRLTEISQELNTLQKLQDLQLYNNLITCVLKTQLPHVQYVTLYNNPIKEVELCVHLNNLFQLEQF
jgi:hypothetical protein